jgi:predicted PurR-regulated permease PerM
MSTAYLNQTLRILALFVLVFGILFFGRSVFIPLTFGAVLAMLLLPVCQWLQSKGLNNGLSSTLSVVALLMVIGALITLLQYQLSDLIDDLSMIEERINNIITGLKSYIKQNFGISNQEQQKIIKEQQSGGMGKVAGIVMQPGKFCKMPARLLSNTWVG